MRPFDWIKKLFIKSAEHIQTSLELHDFLVLGGSNKSISGETITPGTAMRVAAVNAAVKVLAEGVAQLPLFVFKRLKEGGKDKVPDHWLFKLLHQRPNQWQTSFEFRETMMASLLLRGNAYAVKVMRSTRVLELIPIFPDRVQVKQAEDFILDYLITPRLGGTALHFQAKDIFHIKALSSNGFIGLDPLQMARESIGLSLATQRHGSTLFSNSAIPSGTLVHPEELGEEGRDNLKKDWQQMTGGDNQNSVVILEEGMEFKPMGMTSENAQFLETREFQRADIAAIFRVPPHMIGDLKRATFSNIESQNISFITQSLMPWLVRWEQAIQRDLVPRGERDDLVAQFQVAGLLRGDSKARANFYVKMVQNGIYSVNEIRELENLNPREGGDEFLTPLNMESNEDEDKDDADRVDEDQDRETNPA